MTIRFVQLINSALISGKAYLEDLSSGSYPDDPQNCGWFQDSVGTWTNNKNKIGWVDGESILLEPEVAYTVAQQISNIQNKPLTVSNKTLFKRLAERKFTACTANKNLNRMTINGVRKYVLHFPRKNHFLSNHITEPMEALESLGNKDEGHYPPRLSSEDDTLIKEGLRIKAANIENKSNGSKGSIDPQTETSSDIIDFRELNDSIDSGELL